LYASFIAQKLFWVYRLGGHLCTHLGHLGGKQKTESRKQKLERAAGRGEKVKAENGKGCGTSVKPMFPQS
jgi:hypothetical protein